MNFAIAFLVVCVAVTGYATEYPAGLFPALCPNYPYCDPYVLASHYPDGQPKPYHVDHHVHVRRTEYPADFSAAECPNYPFCTEDIPVDPLPGYDVREYPPGISTAECPNYPFCTEDIPVDPLPGFDVREYPPGISVAECPRYPFC